jgi:hypothetical protein
MLLIIYFKRRSRGESGAYYIVVLPHTKINFAEKPKPNEGNNRNTG